MTEEELARFDAMEKRLADLEAQQLQLTGIAKALSDVQVQHSGVMTKMNTNLSSALTSLHSISRHLLKKG